MTYWEHFRANARVAARCAWLCVMHLLHGVVPHRWTSHEFWEGRRDEGGAGLDR